jgi:hypothetical protein
MIVNEIAGIASVHATQLSAGLRFTTHTAKDNAATLKQLNIAWLNLTVSNIG